MKIKAPLQERFFFDAINKSEIIIFCRSCVSAIENMNFFFFSKKRYWELHTWWKMALVRRKNRQSEKGGWKEDRCLKLEIQTAATRMLILLSLYYFFDDGALKKDSLEPMCTRYCLIWWLRRFAMKASRYGN